MTHADITTAHSAATDMARPGIILGISACLVGHEVRFNGGHKQSHYCLDVLSKYMTFKPFCPEVGIGMSVPRQPIRLIGDPHTPRAVGTVDQTQDVTDALYEYGVRTAQVCAGKISGYLLMKNSPSCGLHRVKVYQANGHPHREGGRGPFAQALLDHLPYLPVEEEGRLNDAVLRDNFVTRVYTYHEWQQLIAEELTPARLIGFHSRHKYLLMAHSQQTYKTLGKMLSDLKRADLTTVANQYFATLMEALSQPASRKNHANVLLHLVGYLKRSTSSQTRYDIVERIHQFRQGLLPLVVPITLIKHHIDQQTQPYLAHQSYLQPHPESLGLRNSI